MEHNLTALLKHTIAEGGTYKSLYINHPDAIYVMDVNGNYIDANPATERLSGYTTEEFLQLKQEYLFPHNNNNTLIRKHCFQEALQGKPTSYEIDFMRKDGEIIEVSVTYVPIIVDTTLVVGVYGIAKDITLQKKAEERLKHSESLYKLISENAQDIITYSSPAGICQFISPSVRKLLGYEPEELVGTNFLTIYHPEDFAAKPQQTSDEYLLTARILHKSGHYVWFETTVKRIRNAAGEIEKILAIGRDITDRKRMEVRILESEKQYRLISENSLDLISTHTADDRVSFLYASPSGLALLGYSPAELIGTSAYDYFHPEDIERINEYLTAKLQSQGAYTVEYRVRRKDGHYIWFESTGRYTYDEKTGKIKEIVAISRDITDRKEAEQRLQESEQRYALILGAVSEGIYGVDNQGNTTFVNQAASKMLGYLPSDFIGMINHNNIHHTKTDGSHYPVHECPINLTAHDGRPRAVKEEIFWRKDGSSFLVEYNTNPIIDHGKIKGAVVVFKDITNEKEIIKAMESAERATQAKSEFLAIMSHEIRTPMNGIIGMIDLLLDTELTDEQREYADIIRQSSSSLLYILNDALDFSKIEAGKMALNMEQFELRSTINQIVELLKPKADEKNIELSCRIDSRLPERLTGDTLRIRQILVNLIGNAIKFTNHGSIQVVVNEHPDSNQNGLILDFAIIDTGIGIPIYKMGQLFQSFSQLHPALNRKYGGTGLGLAICKKLVELMNGTISAESVENQGSTFRFTLPCGAVSPLFPTENGKGPAN